MGLVSIHSSEHALPVDSAVGSGERLPLPRDARELVAAVPVALKGVDKLKWYAKRVRDWPDSIRDEIKASMTTLVDEMCRADASDLDMGGPTYQGVVWLRVDGLKVPKPALGRMSVEESNVFLLSQLDARQHVELFERCAVDYGVAVAVEEGAPPRRFRATVFLDNGNLALSQRMLAWKPRTLRSLGFHPVVERGLLFRYLRDGLTLITGVTGSGKSTTLDAIVNANNEDIEAQIIIIAQPLEYIHESKKCAIRHREVGADVATYVDGMVQALRQDPDIVVVGEMRDAQSITTAMELADTGHKVFSTLHTGSAIETIDRIVAEYPPIEQDRIRMRIADIMRCIVCQRLVPAVGGGRILAKEVLWMTPSARSAIKNNNTAEIYQMMWSGHDQGQLTVEQDLYRLLQDGAITAETALAYANNKRRLLKLIQQ